MVLRSLIASLWLIIGYAQAAEDILSTVRDTRSDEVFDYTVDSEFLATIPQWSGPPQNVPLSIDAAIRAAHKKAKEETIEIGPLKYAGLAMRILPDDRNVWAYSITFRAPDEQPPQGKIFIVLLDGTVILPTKRQQ